MNRLIQPLHCYFLMIISTGFMVHVLILPNILTAAKRDSWAGVLLSIFPVLIISFLIYSISRSLKQQPLFLFLKNHYSVLVGRGLAYLLATLLLSEAFVTMKHTLFWAKANYAKDVPSMIIVLGGSILCYYASSKGLKTIAILAPLFFVAVTLLGFFIGISNVPKKDYQLLFPIFEEGLEPSLKGMIYVCAGIFEIVLLLVFQGYSKQPFSIKGIVLLSFILIGLTLGPLMGAIAEFGAEEAAKIHNPAYEEWKLLSIGRYITRVDFLSVFQWLIGAIIRISLFVFFTNELIDFKKKKFSLSILYILLVIGSLIPWNQDDFTHWLYAFYFPIIACALSIYVVVLLVLIKVKRR
ncbi:endospore germination permease [Priestia megaterium]|uniref:endospore germination permease n=1 Tax=Priestia megaterium TaxID=1404 RepID=UPI002731F30D|nr:endospore germination permease [Priestia megaterium]MDP1442108.1 endospore germination permease [Priestia megaterium]MDP1471115.1 endospore germination permease [Priestia megaterium]